MIVVSDASPLITLAKIRLLELLPQLYGTIFITPEIYAEIAVSGAGMAGSSELEAAKWIEVKALEEPQGSFTSTQGLTISAGDLSVIILSKEIQADLTLIDDRNAEGSPRAEG